MGSDPQANDSPYQMSALELATGFVYGGSVTTSLDAPDQDHELEDPVTALEREVLAALRQPPCLVSFSGGVDSSLVLSVATRVARREGLEEPVPATYRIDAPSADESEFQDAVLAELGVKDRVVMDFSNELDVLGPYAQEALHRHGVMFPFNAHGHVPLLLAAAGGTLLTGVGGDELFSPSGRARPLWVAARKVKWRSRNIMSLAFAALPISLCEGAGEEGGRGVTRLDCGRATSEMCCQSDVVRRP